ncbi:MAG TPA: hypothetical protein VFP61_14710, partial [Acidimicrobiales bacterium]|nr:hypothetical protein [Acidimicrobiales bacterium]
LVADLAAATPDTGAPAILLGRLDELADMVAALLERPEPVAPDPVAPPAGPTPAPPEVLDALGRIEVALDGASTPAPPEVLDTLGRIETALAAAVPGAEVVAAIHTLEEVLGRLAAAQADDLERVLEAVEGGAVDGPVSRALEAIGRVEAALDRPAAGTPAGIEAQLSTLTGEVAALRRRLAVRARTLGDEEVAALADAVAARMQGPGPAPRTAPVRRGKAASPAAQASPEQAGPPEVARRPRQPRPGRPAGES